MSVASRAAHSGGQRRTSGRRNVARAFPRLPVLGWSAFSGKRASPLPGVLSAGDYRYTISGRAAIALALRVLGIKPGDKVLVPTYHCPTMITPVVQAGAEPVFYPITAAGGADLRWIERMITADVKVVLAAHYFGLPQPMSQIRAFCAARGMFFIEDCAHAFYGSSDNQPVGSWGDVSIASLTKFFPVQEGGIIASRTHSLNALKLAPRGWHGEIKAAADAVEVGVRFGRFRGLNAAFAGLFGLKNWLRRDRRTDAERTDNAATAGESAGRPLLSSSSPAWAARWISHSVSKHRIIALRRRNYARLASRLSGIAGAHALRIALPDGAAPYVFPLYVNDPGACYQRLRSAGIPIFCWDEVWPGTPQIAGDHGLDWSSRVFQLGCHQDLSLDDIDAMADTVRTLIRNGARRA